MSLMKRWDMNPHRNSFSQLLEVKNDYACKSFAFAGVIAFKIGTPILTQCDILVFSHFLWWSLDQQCVSSEEQQYYIWNKWVMTVRRSSQLKLSVFMPVVIVWKFLLLSLRVGLFMIVKWIFVITTNSQAPTTECKLGRKNTLLAELLISFRQVVVVQLFVIWIKLLRFWLS